jgi:hypothetical protein
MWLRERSACPLAHILARSWPYVGAKNHTRKADDGNTRFLSSFQSPCKTALGLLHCRRPISRWQAISGFAAGHRRPGRWRVGRFGPRSGAAAAFGARPWAQISLRLGYCPSTTAWSTANASPRLGRWRSGGAAGAPGSAATNTPLWYVARTRRFLGPALPGGLDSAAANDAQASPLIFSLRGGRAASRCAGRA